MKNILLTLMIFGSFEGFAEENLKLFCVIEGEIETIAQPRKIKSIDLFKLIESWEISSDGVISYSQNWLTSNEPGLNATGMIRDNSEYFDIQHNISDESIFFKLELVGDSLSKMPVRISNLELGKWIIESNIDRRTGHSRVQADFIYQWVGSDSGFSLISYHGFGDCKKSEKKF